VYDLLVDWLCLLSIYSFLKMEANMVSETTVPDYTPQKVELFIVVARP
jgi:hypothetical protein